MNVVVKLGSGMHGAKPFEVVTPPPYFCLLEPYARLQKPIILSDHRFIFADDALEVELSLLLCPRACFAVGTSRI